MTRLVLFLVTILGLSFGFSWLADNPGTITVDWQGYHAEPTVFQVVVLTAVLTALGICVWTVARQIWTSPAAVSHFLTKRRQQRGLDALSSGMIAIGAGDRATATRYALQARKSLPNEPLTHLLRAQAAQLSGDRATSRRIFEAMLSAPDTEQLGLRGLYLEAARENEGEAQRQFAERAIALNPKLAWPVEGLFDLQCKEGDWAGALNTLAISRRHGTVEKTAIDRRRAVLLTGQALALEDSQSEKALGLALEAHALAKDLVPAAALAGRLLAARGNTAKAAKVVQRTWSRAPHPDLAAVYAYARIGDSPRDRLERIRQLAALNPHSSEGVIALANAAIEAHDFDEARNVLSPLLDGRLTRRVATLMARIEKEQHGDRGRVREWLARAVHAGRDPAWTADGVVAQSWAPVSPVTGALDAFQWRVPVEEFDTASSMTGAVSPLEEFMALETVFDSAPVPDPEPAAVNEPEPKVSTREPASRQRDANLDRAVEPPVGSAPSNVQRPAERGSETAARTAVRSPSTGPRIEAREAEVVVTRRSDIDPVENKDFETGSDGDGAGAGAASIPRRNGKSFERDVETSPASRSTTNKSRNLVEDDVTPTVVAPKTANASAAASRTDQVMRGPALVAKTASRQPTNDRKSVQPAAGSSAPKRWPDAAVIVPLHAPDDPGSDPDSDDDNGSARSWPYRKS